MILSSGGGYSRIGDKEYAEISVPSDQTNATVTIQIAAGPWLVFEPRADVRGSAKNGQIGSDKTDHWEAAWGQVSQNGNNSTFTYTDSLDNLEHRFVALDPTGAVLATRDGGDSLMYGGSIFTMYGPVFPDVALGKIANFRIDLRDFAKKVEYRNISLKPGTHSDFAIVQQDTPSRFLKGFNLKPAPTDSGQQAKDNSALP